ncbi:CheY-like chemotaxis protein/GGDEF domain-containing protein [Loktanella ponticola]|uniref:CheY-like chemotaxis protein/GGDEF domain-containing protein n=1 Tax=Yoonia ponticola TaxID=1524255 RepID=A0A7W9BMT5_9RHOB|nr:response regulator [Yoonia ponticola]MBB5723241.1 CheY-like chemotaxis protein/GGDEF domain-containing protein [Yoonia ponticola]
MKILAVDDDPFILEILTMMAAKVGYTDVVTMPSGESALNLLNKGKDVFDCMLLDINMPGIDGIELCKLVRSLPDYDKTPIIMLTAMSDKDHILRAFKAGATDYASKPFDIVELNARLRMAEQVVVARQEVAAVLPSVNTEEPEVDTSPSFELSDEIQIEGISDIIGYGALANYLTQLSTARLTGSQVFAVKIDQIEAIYAQATSDEFLYAVSEVADAINTMLQSSGYLMAYAGNGAFVVVSNKATLESSAALEAEVQNLLDEKNTEFDNGNPLDLEVSFGNPIRPNASKNQRVRKTFDRAIARAENRVLKKRNDPRAVSVRLVGL